MARVSEKHHWDEYWAASKQLDDVYANDNRIVEFLAGRFDLAGMRVLEVGAGTGREPVSLRNRAKCSPEPVPFCSSATV